MVRAAKAATERVLDLPTHPGISTMCRVACNPLRCACDSHEIKNPLNVISYFLNSISLSAAANDSPPINGTTENSVFSAQFLPDAIRCAQLLVCLL